MLRGWADKATEVVSFAPVPAGWFVMGSAAGQRDEAPVHRVWVDAFELAVDPVTRTEYARFREETGRAAPREWDNPRFADPELPVVGVSWNDAVVYCLWRSSQGGRLRCGCRPRRNGNGPPAARRRAGTIRGATRCLPGSRTAAGGPLDGPWPVSLGPPNDFGIRGIAANIHEWCADWHSRDFYERSPVRNPAGATHGIRRVSRGGSWRHAVTISRVAARSKLDPSFRYTDYGFRVARDV